MNASLLVVALGMSLSAAPSEPFGAVAVAPLERGALAMYATAGYPELRAGFRQGLRGYELGVEAGFDMTLARVYAAAMARTAALESGQLRISADAQAGAFAASGARHVEPQNEAGAGLRLMLGSTLTFKTDWPLALNAFAKAPLELPLGDTGTTRLSLVIGGGAEVALSPQYFVTVGGGFGPELRRRVSKGRTTASLAVEAMVGFGYRVF